MSRVRLLAETFLLSATWFIAISCATHPGHPTSEPGRSGYALRISTPDHAGDRTSLETIVSNLESVSTMWSGRATSTKEYAYTYHLIADTEVLRTNLEQQATAMRCRIRKLTSLKNGKEVDLLKPGTDVLAEDDGQRTIFRIAGATPEPNVRAALVEVIELPSSHDHIDWDAALSTESPHRPGKGWAVDPSAAARAFDAYGIRLVPADVGGTVRIERIEHFNGLTCARLVAELHIGHDFFNPATQDDNGYVHHVISGSCDLHCQWLTPIQGNHNVQWSDLAGQMHYRVAGQYGDSPYGQDCTDDWERVTRILPTTQP